MGKYSEVEKLISSSVLDYTNLNIVPRGTPIFPDLLMTGSARFARRLGANFSVLNPDNQVELSADATEDQYQVSVSRILPWFEQGSLVTFNQIEMYQISDYDTVNKTLTFSNSLSAPRSEGSKLYLWATPMVLHVNAMAGDSIITVRSRYNLVNGDAVTFPVSSLLSSLTQRDVLLAQTAGDSGDSDFPYLYTLILSDSIPISLTAGTSPIYLRAFPSYISKPLRVTKFAAEQLGPFLLDYVASPLDSVTSYPATFSIRTIDNAGVPVAGALNSLKTASQNYPVTQRPIWAENLLFWKVIRGSGGFIYPNKYRLITDSKGKARVSSRIVPTMLAGQGWKFKVTATSAGTISFFSGPNTTQIYNLLPNTPQVITLSTDSSSDSVDRIEIIAKLNAPNTEIVIADSTVVGQMVTSIQYAYVFRVLGETNFQSTSVIIKPYFLSLSDLSAKYDSGQKYNSGLIYR